MMQEISLKRILFSSSDGRTKLIKVLDFLLGNLLVRFLKSKKKEVQDYPVPEIKKILVLRPGGIGDAVLLIPFLRELKNVFPNVSVDIVAEKRNCEVFEMVDTIIERVFLYDNWKIFFLIRSLKSTGYDILFDTEQWHNLSAIFSYLSVPKASVGFDTRIYRSKFYTHRLSYNHDDYEVDSFLNLLKPFLSTGQTSSALTSRPAPGGFISIPKGYSDWAGDRLKNKGNIVALCLSSSIKEKQWPIENFKELITFLINSGYVILLFGGKKEKKGRGFLFRVLPPYKNIIDFVGKINLRETAALLKYSDFYIGLDSGILQLAYGAGIPTVSLFGPGNKNKWAPRGAKHIVLSAELACSPCGFFGYTLLCRYTKCMISINVEKVFKAVDRMKVLSIYNQTDKFKRIREDT